MTNTNTKVVTIVEWEESERGWGTRPDGISIHLNRLDATDFIDWFMNDQCKRLGNETPNEYTRSCGLYEECISDSLYDKVLAAKAKGELGLRFWKTLKAIEAEEIDELLEINRK